MNPRNPIKTVANTIEEYPNNLFLEKVEKISENIPKAGSIKMYTSGCPKIQKRCSHIIVLPPAATLKKFAPNILSNVRRNKPTVSGGNANRINADATKVVQENIGIRIYVIPGARMLIMVTRKLIPPIKVPKPDI